MTGAADASSRSWRAVALGALGLAACGGGSDDSQPRVLEAGQVDVKLPPGFKVVNQKVVVVKKKKVGRTEGRRQREATATTTTGASTPTAPPGGGTTPTTVEVSVPLDKNSNPTDDLLASFGKFRDCLNDENVKFIGAPDASNPESPTNDPDYIKALSTCAARSNIVQALRRRRPNRTRSRPHRSRSATRAISPGVTA